MIPTPRPGPRHGDCPDCGRQHDGDCHLAEMERNREAQDVVEAPRLGMPCGWGASSDATEWLRWADRSHFAGFCPYHFREHRQAGNDAEDDGC